MTDAVSNLAVIGLYILYILLPILALFFAYEIITKGFKYMGFGSIEAIIIVFICFLLGSGFIDDYVGFSFSNIHLFDYYNWKVGINTGGAVIPILLSIYLIIKKKISYKYVLFGISVVTIVTYFVTYAEPNKGIVSPFPLWLLPAFFASITSVILLWKKFRKAAPLSYVSGTIGVLIGADFLHLHELLSNNPGQNVNAVIGGAVVFDMIFITGILAVILDGLIMFRQRKREGFG